MMFTRLVFFTFALPEFSLLSAEETCGIEVIRDDLGLSNRKEEHASLTINLDNNFNRNI